MILSSWETKTGWEYVVHELNSPPESFGRFEGIVRLWNDKRRDGRLPAWSDFDFEDFEGWWGWITVIDLEFSNEKDNAVADARYRLWGSNMADLLAVDPTNTSIRSPDNSFEGRDSGLSHHDFRHFEELVNGPAIGYSSGKVHWVKECTQVTLLNVRLPLADDGKAVDKLMGVFLRDDPKE